MCKSKVFFTPLKEEESRQGLMEELVQKVDFLWERKSVYRDLTSERELQF